PVLTLLQMVLPYFSRLPPRIHAPVFLNLPVRETVHSNCHCRKLFPGRGATDGRLSGVRPTKGPADRDLLSFSKDIFNGGVDIRCSTEHCREHFSCALLTIFVRPPDHEASPQSGQC